MQLVEVWINCPSTEVAETIGNAALRRRIAACWNLHAAVRSAYHWKGEVETATEFPLVLKTRRDLFEAVAACARELHPYETPSIIAVDIAATNRDYAGWLLGETGAPETA